MKDFSFLHFADLHLSEKERTYSMAVLKELVDKASSCDAIVIAGDFFDSFSDMLALWKPAMGLLASFEGIVIYCVGNHEYLGKGKHSFSEFLPADNVRFIYEPGLSVVDELEDVEFLVLPFSGDNSSFDASSATKPSGKKRVFVSHGTLGGMYDFFSDEEDSAVISPSVLEAVGADYAALGHIHSAVMEKSGTCLFCYPGSSRVWRRGESGKRACVKVRLSSSVETEKIFLESAGQWRELSFVAGAFELSFLEDIEAGEHDYLSIRLEGVMESMQAVEDLKKELEGLFANRLRKLDIEDNVELLDNMSEYKIVKRFIEKMNNLKDSCDKDIWDRALLKGLLELKEEILK